MGVDIVILIVRIKLANKVFVFQYHTISIELFFNHILVFPFLLQLNTANTLKMFLKRKCTFDFEN